MAVRIDILDIKKTRTPAVRNGGMMSRELGEAVAEMLPALLEGGLTLEEISHILWGKSC